MANPRVDELKRRIEREPASRLFAQLAEELRKDGDLAEAIRVARTGLQAHPNYPSARLTLGRCLFETGQLAAARNELEGLLRAAPDNILAARMLAECLEGLGDAGAALLQYRAALRLSPEDRQIEAHVRTLEQRLGGQDASRPSSVAAPSVGSAAGGPAAARGPAPPLPIARTPPQAAPAPAPAPAPAAPAPRAPAEPQAQAAPAPRPPSVAAALPREVPPPVAVDHGPDFDDVFEPGPSWKRPAGGTSAPAPDAILLMEDEAPTMPGSPYAKPLVAPPPPVAAVPAPPIEALAQDVAVPDEPDTLAGAPAFAVPPPPAPEPPPAASFSAGDAWVAESAVAAEADTDGASTAAFKALSPEPSVEEPAPAPAPESIEPPAAEPARPMSTPTMAEIYFDQGLFARAVEVYEEVLEREPLNDRARARLIEVKAMALTLDGPPGPDPRAERRQAIQRTISKLEQMLAAVRRG